MRAAAWESVNVPRPRSALARGTFARYRRVNATNIRPGALRGTLAAALAFRACTPSPVRPPPASPQPSSVPAGALELAARDRPGAWRTPRPALPGEFAILAQPDLQKGQAGGQDEPKTDQHEREDLSRTPAHEHGADRSCNDEGSR